MNGSDSAVNVSVLELLGKPASLSKRIKKIDRNSGGSGGEEIFDPLLMINTPPHPCLYFLSFNRNEREHEMQLKCVKYIHSLNKLLLSTGALYHYR